jgi:hypothetical protein
MSTDKRSVHTDALETLGTIIGPDEKRDAIHLGVEPAIAGQYLVPGDHVVLRNGYAYKTDERYSVGIVDPFISRDIDVESGQRFWLVVKPRTITSLRHVWEHPDFPKSNETTDETVERVYNALTKDVSEKWIRDFIAQNDLPPYEVIISAVENRWDMTAEYLTISGYDAYGDIPNEFWDHVEIVMDIKVGVRPTYFSCSC